VGPGVEVELQMERGERTFLIGNHTCRRKGKPRRMLSKDCNQQEKKFIVLKEIDRKKYAWRRK